MYPKPTRLFVIKFLGLWGAANNSKLGPSDNDLKEQPSELASRIRQDSSSYTDDSAALVDKLQTTYKPGLKLAIDSSRKKITSLLLEKGIPGLTVCVSRKGETIWKAAFGFCDVENQLQCEPDAHMRIASISKSIFVGTVVAPMIENNKIDIKSTVDMYLTKEEFPKQKFNGKEYGTTIEQLLSHTSGIRHYDEGAVEKCLLRPIGSKGSMKIYQNDDQFNRLNFYQRKTFRDVIEALEPFKDGPLDVEPGQYNYTTYGYTLLSAVIERAHKAGDKDSESEQIEDVWIKTLHRDWDLRETYLDQEERVISKRSRYYLRSGFNGGLINAPYSDLSIKWAGGGIISTTDDLVKFGNALLDCYKGRQNAKLKRETLDLLWKEVKGSYGLGFQLTKAKKGEELGVYHSGGALGASSLLFMFPDSEIVVAILTNMGSISLLSLGIYLANEFKKVQS